MIELGIVSDEICPDFREAVALGMEWGITRYEIRCVKSGRVPAVDQAEWEDILACVQEHGLSVTALSPGIFKHQLSKKDDLTRELEETLPRTIAMARQCACPLIIVFGIQREKNESPQHYREVLDLLRRAALVAQQQNVRLAIENEPGFWCDTGANTARIIHDVNVPSLGANWDPCNAYGTIEVPYPDGYRAIRPMIFNVHAKDTKRGALIECVPVGKGVIDWKGQVEALLRDKIVGHITIETHALPLVEKSKENVDTLRHLLSNGATSKGLPA
jgi:sugar phosphate isomerase/epimerase